MSVSPMEGVSSGAVVRVQDEGTDLAFKPKINFTGAGVSAAVNGSVIDVTISGASTLDSLSDVVITTPATGATLIYDGTNWVDGQLDLADGDARTGTLPVANGGTGLTTATVYAVLCGGTTGTGAFQSIAGVGTSGQILTSNGAGALPTFQAAAGGGSTLDGITAATADETGIANADWNVRWNWAKVVDSEAAFEFGESAAATGGTSTSGVPNQVLLKLSTLAASTMSPLSVYVRGAHVVSASPSVAQLLYTNGSASAPSVAATGATTTGLFWDASPSLNVAVSGGTKHRFFDGLYVNSTAGSPTAVAIAIATSGATASTGFYSPTTAQLAIAIATNKNMLWSAGICEVSYGAADAVSYAFQGRKSRGTTASPTVITTGDDLLTISGYGYVGATNTYQEAARITFDSTGTISDSATGIGGIIRFSVAAVGAEPAEVLTLMAATTTGGGWAIMDEADANPTTTELTAGEHFAMYRKADKLVFAYNAAGTINYLVATLDGATTTWTNSTTAP